MNNYDLQKMLHTVSGSIDGAEKLAVPFLAKKAAQYSKQMPHDKTVGKLTIVLAKMVENNTIFISRAEFRDLFAKSHTSGTKAKELFAKELNVAEDKSPVTYADKRYETELEVGKGDEILSTALSDALSGQAIRGYSETVSKKAVSMVAKTLDIWGMNPVKLFVSAGSPDYLVIQADYETPKGITSVHIPVETSGSKVIESSVFVGNSEPQELNNSNLKNYIKTYAGSKLSLNGDMLLSALGKLASKENIVSGAEMALIRLNAKRKAHTELEANNISGFKIDAQPLPDLEEKRYEEADRFEDKIAAPYGEAAFKFGKDKLALARNILVRELASCGHTAPQLKVSKCTDDSVFYAVSLGSVAFTAPIKIESGLVQLPTILISNGSVKPFTTETIQSLHNDHIDCRAAAVASPLYDLKPSDLIASVREAVADKNLPKAEDALNVLASSGDEISYAKALRIFMAGLGQKESKAETKCSMILKTATSQQPVCGHTGLALNKVYQDEHGDCRPKYRQAMDDTFEGFLSMDSKVFL